METHCIWSIVKVILIPDNSSLLLSILCWEDPDPANEKESGSFQELHSIIVNRKLLYTDKNWLFCEIFLKFFESEINI